tara:strand:- start:2657 stop:3331 length:675 start_codon:yes stop_codon:yes gene_type:complete
MPFIGVQPATVPLTSSDITDGIVTTAKIADTAISTAKIADDAVTGAKIENSPTIANGLTLADGNLVMASGHGIDFSATSDGTTMGNELFDDYEEGTFTPLPNANSATFNFTTQAGFYTRIGRNVNFQIYVVIGSSGNTLTGNQLYINNLPFNSANTTNNVRNFLMSGRNLNVDSSYNYVIASLDLNNNYLVPLMIGDNVAQENFRADDLANLSQIIISGSYIAS